MTRAEIHKITNDGNKLGFFFYRIFRFRIVRFFSLSRYLLQRNIPTGLVRLSIAAVTRTSAIKSVNALNISKIRVMPNTFVHKFEIFQR